MKLLRLLLVAMLGVALLPPRATAAQAQAPTPLVITAHNVTAATAPARDNSAVVRPGDVIRYTLVFTNVTAGPVKNIQCVAAIPPPPPGRAAHAPPPRVITAHNGPAATAPARDNSAVVRPGDVIRYTLVFTNVTAGPVKNIQFVDPIPKGMVYVLGSATGDRPVRVEYSIDGGKSYSARPVIAVVEDGKKVETPAPRERYTHVRWTVLGSLDQKARVMAEFR